MTNFLEEAGTLENMIYLDGVCLDRRVFVTDNPNKAFFKPYQAPPKTRSYDEIWAEVKE